MRSSVRSAKKETVPHLADHVIPPVPTPKTSIGFGVGGKGKTVMPTWFDDVSIEPLESK